MSADEEEKAPADRAEASGGRPDERSSFEQARDWFRLLFILPVLLIYITAIYVGSIPPEIRTEWMGEWPKKTWRTMEEYHVTPSHKVFIGRAGDWKRGKLCTVIFGEMPSGETEILFETYPGCIYPGFRTHGDIWDVVISRAQGTALSHDISFPNSRKAALKNLRNRRRLAAVSRFYCESETVNTGAKKIWVAWWAQPITWSDGRRRNVRTVVHQYDCEQKRISRAPVPRFRTAGPEGPRLDFSETTPWNDMVVYTEEMPPLAQRGKGKGKGKGRRPGKGASK